MKIFLFRKKEMVIIILIILISIILLASTCLFKTNDCVATELITNSKVSDAFLEKIKNLTKGEEKIAYLTFDD